MIDFLVVETTAEQRNKLCERLLTLQSEISRASVTAPQISLRPAAPQEMSYVKHPDFIVLGQKFLSEDLVEIVSVRKIFPDVRIIAEVSKELSSLIIIEQMARLGVDDILTDDLSAYDFFRKIIVLGKKEKSKSLGKLIVIDSGKGGAGATTIVAAFAEILRSAKQKVCLVDLDTESQDLSRFLQIRPACNENLSVILESGRSIIKESIDQMIIPVDDDVHEFGIIPPPLTSLYTDDPRATCIRVLLSVLENLDSMYDIVIIDAAGTRGCLQASLQKIADTYIFVSNPDIASIFSTVQSILKAVALGSLLEIKVLINERTHNGLPLTFVASEICTRTGLKPDQVLNQSIPYCQNFLSWPGSSAPLFSGNAKKSEAIFKSLLTHLGYRKEHEVIPLKNQILQKALKNAKEKIKKIVIRQLRTPVKIIGVNVPQKQINPSLSLPSIEPPRNALSTIE